jgi:hypothetical protein
MRWWLSFWSPRRARPRDPDLDYAKQQLENHEYRLQVLEHEADELVGGSTPYSGAERRSRPRIIQH